MNNYTVVTHTLLKNIIIYSCPDISAGLTYLCLSKRPNVFDFIELETYKCVGYNKRAVYSTFAQVCIIQLWLMDWYFKGGISYITGKAKQQVLVFDIRKHYTDLRYILLLKIYSVVVVYRNHTKFCITDIKRMTRAFLCFAVVKSR